MPNISLKKTFTFIKVTFLERGFYALFNDAKIAKKIFFYQILQPLEASGRFFRGHTVEVI